MELFFEFAGNHPIVAIVLGFLVFLAFTWICGAFVTVIRGHKPQAYCPSCSCAHCREIRKGKDES